MAHSLIRFFYHEILIIKMIIALLALKMLYIFKNILRYIFVYLIGLIVTIIQLSRCNFKPTNLNDIKRRKIALVTGGTSGIGQAIVKKLSALNYIVIAPVVHKPSKPLTKAVNYMYMDLRDVSSVKKTSLMITKKYSKIDLLINCAGVMFVPLQYTSLHLEEHFMVNYLGHFLLTLICMASLNSAPRARIINVTSSLHWLGEVNISANIISPLPSEYSPYLAYASSKLYLIMFTHKLARSLSNTSVSVVAYDPGTVNTGLYQHAGWLSSSFVQLLGGFLLRSPADAAEDLAYLIDAELVHDSLCYLGWKGCFGSCKSVSKDTVLQDKLWDVSSELTATNLSKLH